MTSDDRMVVKAFVCDNGCVKHQHYEGSVDILKLVELRPKECRYAVVHWYDRFVVLDMTGDDGMIVKAATSHTDLDAAIMAAQLTY